MRLSRQLLIVPLVAVALVSLGARPDTASAQQAVTVQLSPQNSSGITGTATLTPMGDQTRVVLTLAGAGAGPEPAHIHAGTCADLDPTPKWPLTSVANGVSDTMVNAKLSDIQASATAINIHKSPQEISVYVACGNIPTAAAAGAAPAAAPAGAPGATPGTPAPVTSAAAPATAPSAGAPPAGPVAAPAAAAAQPARPPAQLPRTGESGFELYGLLALGVLVLVAGMGLMIRRRWL